MAVPRSDSGLRMIIYKTGIEKIGIWEEE